jgi:hypothetical protein
MLHTLGQHIRHDEEVLKTRSESLLQRAGVVLISMIAFLAVCAAILLLER